MMTTATRADAPLVLIFGLGESGAAAARWCARQGARLRVADTRADPGGLLALQETLAHHEVEYRLGCAENFDPALLDHVQQIVVSPGLAPHVAPMPALLQAATERGIEVVGEIELFARALTELAETQQYHPKVLAITGTNGKTTVTALTRELVQAGGLTVRAAGNISPAALEALMLALDDVALPDVWVLELSSYQLETTHTLKAHAAVVLNVTQDHLDWHGDMHAYAKAKARLLTMADIAIVNRDDAITLAMIDSLSALQVRSFGHKLPEYLDDMGLDQAQGMTWLVAAELSDFDVPAAPVRRKKGAPEPTRPLGRMSRLIPMDALRIRGLHNALNALAALQLARCLNVGWGPLLRALQDYAGEPHRAAFVRMVGDVEYVNDSKGTNVGATVAALQGAEQTVVLIAGGQGKGQDFSPLATVVSRHARAVVLLGQDGPSLAQALVDTGVHCSLVDSMRTAVRRAAELAQPGDMVLLSPACASLDMFRNYVHRGQVFVDEVQELARDSGEVA